MLKQLRYLFLLIFAAFLITACSKSPDVMRETTQNDAAAENSKIQTDEKLGTKWGDEINSSVEKVDLQRVSDTPIDEKTLRYAAKSFKGTQVNSISLAAGQISFSVIGEDKKPLPIYRADNQYFVRAQEGQSYQLKYVNHTGQTYEVVASVDGLDVIYGDAASRQSSGYVLSPNASLIIDGFRKSDQAVASFTFSKPEQSYANHNSDGSIDNTGIIGTVIYQLDAKDKKPKQKGQYAPAPNAFPGDR